MRELERLPPFPCARIISAAHIIADLTLGLGKVVYDYLKP
jgi:acetoacetate decarboxylase